LKKEQLKQTSVHCRLGEVRRIRGVGVSDLARRIGVTRQTIYAIEAGTYIPNTEVTLKLSRELEVPVEELFSLHAEEQGAAKRVQSDVLSEIPSVQGQAVQVCRIDRRLVSVPVSGAPDFLPEADAVIAKSGRSQDKAELYILSEEDTYTKRLVLAGCDPALGLLARMAERSGGVQIIAAAASSRLALNWLKQGKAHVAGMHLKDTLTGEFNLPILRRDYPDEDFAVVTFARWEEGFVTAPGNPKGIREVADLARGKLRFVNRESGSGSRALLDTLLINASVPETKVGGYDRIARGHLAAAYMVHTDAADCCIATRSAAKTFGLSFVPLQTERYDFVMPRKLLDLPALQVFLDVLQKASLRRKLEVFAEYDTAETGAMLA
jgi:putative molybdopterin biosynthesis protein